MLMRFLFLALIIYLAYRVINALVFGAPPKREHDQVKGKPRNRPLDLSNLDVEDAKFQEIKENNKDGQ
ncbi:MAG: hypothetical protein ONB46_03250 [candidate division KSB1 bacterium]|nr:hypothetical protein [candidate division KSB1 bacterium]MDZ7365061.1 hypothetical protein [candidate division KSB1 bacterium]MDZ7403455.1 hypothetical protein [candidate division KSB1 bacterium]